VPSSLRLLIGGSFHAFRLADNAAALQAKLNDRKMKIEIMVVAAW
jgi:hypothetical protein